MFNPVSDRLDSKSEGTPKHEKMLTSDVDSSTGIQETRSVLVEKCQEFSVEVTTGKLGVRIAGKGLFGIIGIFGIIALFALLVIILSR